jgi:ATP-dependent DNA ligase
MTYRTRSHVREVEELVGHIGQQLDGIIGKHTDAPYRPGG